MKRVHGTPLCVAVLGFALALLGNEAALRASAAEPAERPPNIVLILIDDLGYGDLGAFGNKVHRTPRIDQMAAEGMKLTSFYAAPCCTPARAAVMTGCYARRVGLNDGPQEWVLLPKDAIGLNPEEITIAELLKSRGYATACIGKWHLGDQQPFLPTRHGFDMFFGLPYSNDMWPPFNESDNPRMVAMRKRFNHAPLPLMRGERVLHAVTDQSLLTATYTREALQFIRDHADEPFFLYFPHSMVHAPVYPGKRFQGKSQNGKYGDAVEEIDWSTGEILDVLSELGLAEQTLVLVTSDNGASPVWGGSNAPLRGGKASTLEGGVRVPCIARWPGRIPASATCDELATLMDLLPTFAKLAGAKLPDDRIIDGKDIWPLLAGQPDARSPYEAFYYFSRRSLDAVRSGPWKLRLTNGALFDLSRDIAEKHNVASRHPDVVARLTKLAEQARLDIGDGTDEFPGKNVRPPGHVDHPRRLIEHDGTIAPDAR